METTSQVEKESKEVKRARHAWYYYDFGNSAYAAIILLAVFSIYFKNVVVGGAEGTRLWGIAVGIAAIIVAVVSPILGAIADVSRSKKLFLGIFTAISIAFTGLLFFVGPGDVLMAMIFFILAEIGYRGAQVFYDALLVDVSTPETVGNISGKGWAIGMLGGIATLIIVLVPMQLIGDAFKPNYAFLITALVFLVSAIPTFLYVKEKHEVTEQLPFGKLIKDAFKKLADTFKEIRHYKDFLRYMFAFLIYNDGIMMLMDFAAIIGGTLFGLGTIELLIFVIIIHITGAIGALVFGRIADRASSKRAILYSLLILIVSLIALFFIGDNRVAFFIVGGFAGFSLSGAQAVSRTMVSQLAPPDKMTEFYGFLSVAGRTSTFVGPLVFSTLAFRMSNFYLDKGWDPILAENGGQYWGIGSIILFLVVGMIILLTVREVTAQDPMVYNNTEEHEK
ncbi:MAG: MFS transporter [Chloroflexi bacterium]|nr:MFS transporter [Chloroflexota bacterium]